MIWLAWRQFRPQAIVAACVLAVTALVLGLAGLHLEHLYNAAGLTRCRTAAGCDQASTSFLNQLNSGLGNHLPLLFGTALVVVPALIGMFWGAPLITRELEAGTHRLALAQGVSRTRWLAVKLGLIGFAGLLTAGLFSLLVTWSAGPIDAVNADRLTPAVFSERGIAPIGYTAFALALGVAAGMLIRRTVPAMAVTLAVFTAVQFAMRPLRQYLITPLRAVTPIMGVNSIYAGAQAGGGGSLVPAGPAGIPGAWVYSAQTINAAGHVIGAVPLSPSGPVSVQNCGGQAGETSTCFTALAQHGFRQLLTYQPGGRFWAFQWYETAIFLALALAVTGFCFWWIRRRLG
jgi:ABC-type transport system involved in multi-copper enzyme maturation permease subunit